MPLKVKKLHPDAIAPTCANPGEDLGFDLYALEDTLIPPGIATKVRTGISAIFTPYENARKHGLEYGLLIRDRSSLASKGLMVSGGVIDAGYRGEIMVVMTTIATRLYYSTDDGYFIKAGDKIAQMIPMSVQTHGKIEVVEELPESIRGEGGFGSSGR